MRILTRNLFHNATWHPASPTPSKSLTRHVDDRAGDLDIGGGAVMADGAAIVIPAFGD